MKKLFFLASFVLFGAFAMSLSAQSCSKRGKKACCSSKAKTSCSSKAKTSCSKTKKSSCSSKAKTSCKSSAKTAKSNKVVGNRKAIKVSDAKVNNLDAVGGTKKEVVELHACCKKAISEGKAACCGKALK